MNYNLRRQNYNYFVRYHNNVPYIYYSDFIPPQPPVSSCDYPLFFPCIGYGYSTSVWNTDSCQDGLNQVYSKILPKINYLWTQLRDPPSNVYSLICPNDYDVNLSKKIKITIVEDPIFSGIYVFDYSPGNGDSQLLSDNWVINSGESQHNLVPYDHPESPQDGKILVSLNDYAGSTFPYNGYLELKASLYNDENNTGAEQIENAYAFPSHMVFTAVRAPCPCSGYTGTAWPKPSTVGSGHRLSVGFALPIRWRHPYKDWIIVDKVTHRINTIPNYTTGNIFNDGTYYYSSEQQQNVYLNNSIAISGTISYAPGTANTAYTGGYFSTSSTTWGGMWNTCTGINNLGFAFRSSASGLGYDRGFARYLDTFTAIQGIGPFNYFDRYYVWDGEDPDSDLDIVDERPFFDNKTPVIANIDFVYSCRPGLPCMNFNGSTIAPISSSGVGCFGGIKSNIDIDYLCGEYAQSYPPDSHWISGNITSTQIIYSGFSGILPIVLTGEILPSSTSYSYWDTITQYSSYVTYDETPIINIPYTGYLPSQIRDFLTNKFYAVSFNYSGQSSLYNTNDILQPYLSLDLHWNVDYNNHTAKVYVSPDDNEIKYPIIVITGAGTNEINGTYYYAYGNNSPRLNDTYFAKVAGETEDRRFYITYSYSGLAGLADPTWKIGKFASGSTIPVIQNDRWITYYWHSGVLIDSSDSPYNRNNWYIDSCSSGLYPTPTAIIYYH